MMFLTCTAHPHLTDDLILHMYRVIIDTEKIPTGDVWEGVIFLAMIGSTLSLSSKPFFQN